MTKLKMHSPNKVDENIEKIGQLFPNCLTERKNEAGKVEYAIDFDVLRQELTDVVVEGNEERYQFTWPDKKKSIHLANAPIAKTLRPVRDDEYIPTGVNSSGNPYCSSGSVDFDNTENLYIEGDNLDVLKLLQETYLGKVKMIYIDPPYNTGNDFVYEDDFTGDIGEFLIRDEQYDDEGNRMVKNLDSNGRFHTDWLNMIYPRLKLAKDLLTDDGVIFISIDDHEQANLKKVCDEIFGEINFIANIVWQKKTSPDARMEISAAHDNIIAYAKGNCDTYRLSTLPYGQDRLKNYQNPDNDPRGPWASVDITGQTGRAPKSQFYEITTPSGIKYFPPEGRCWAMAQYTFELLYKDNRLWFGEDGNNRPRQKKFLSESKGARPWTWWDNKFAGHNQDGNKELMALFDGKLIFDNPKPIKLLKLVVLLTTKKDKNDICMDFFSGSAGFAEAVMTQNAEDNGNRRFICVQIPQVIQESENDYKSNSIALSIGYKNICEIGKERIRRAGEKIRNEKLGGRNDSSEAHSSLLTSHSSLDTGFRVLKLDSTNMKDVYYNPNDYDLTLFEKLTENIKEDRTPEDLLFQVMLDLGILLSSKIEETMMAGKKVFNVMDNYLIACFDDDITDETVKAIALRKPHYAVFRDSSMADDNVATNFEQIFDTYSPDTVRKVL